MPRTRARQQAPSQAICALETTGASPPPPHPFSAGTIGQNKPALTTESLLAAGSWRLARAWRAGAQIAQHPLLFRRQDVLQPGCQREVGALDLAFGREHLVELGQQLRLIHLVLAEQLDHRL